ncbi:MAG: hypothetical protein WD278_01840, partial [Pirellulales bacterium]
MPKELDVYREWLGIRESARPLNYYQLLRLKPFEDDPAKVRGNYRKMNAHVRKYAAGEYGAQSQELLNELAKAMLVLTDTVRKTEYDASQGRTDKRAGRGRTLEEILVGRKVIDSAQLDKARRYAKTVGVEIRDAVMQQKLAPAEQVMQAYAESVGLPFVDVADVGIDESLVPQVPAVLARQHSCAPLMIDDGRLLMVSPNPLVPEVEDQLRLRFGVPVRTVLCTPGSIHEAINQYFPREAAAAQLAAGPAKPATAAKPAEKTAAPAAPAAAIDPNQRAANQKRRVTLAILGFNFSVIAFVAAAFLTGAAAGLGWWYFPVAVLVG